MAYKDKVIESWTYTIGSKGGLNVLGKVFFFPFWVWMVAMVSILHFLFSKKEPQ